jgi:hypothetical protein
MDSVKLTAPMFAPITVMLEEPDDNLLVILDPLSSLRSSEKVLELVPVRIPTVIDILLDPSVP